MTIPLFEALMCGFYHKPQGMLFSNARARWELHK
jgi:hypothetical protein